MSALPVVLCFGGTDPTGGAGLTADTLALAGLGCHAATVVTAVTAQDTSGLKQFTTIDPELVIAQARAVLEDMPVAAIKTGMLASATLVAAIESILQDYPSIPLIVDPVLATNAGQSLADEPLEDAIRALLVPRTTLITPNSPEARALAPEADSLDACAQELLSLGAEYVLITGAHELTEQVINRLHGPKISESFYYERLPGDYHGSGCTLTAACAGAIAHGVDVVNAVVQGQRFTWNALRHGWRPGTGQMLPDRLFWARNQGPLGPA